MGVSCLCMATPLVRYADCLDMGVVRARSCVLSSVNPVFFSVLQRDGDGKGPYIPLSYHIILGFYFLSECSHMSAC